MGVHRRPVAPLQQRDDRSFPAVACPGAGRGGGRSDGGAPALFWMGRWAVDKTGRTGARAHARGAFAPHRHRGDGTRHAQGLFQGAAPRASRRMHRAPGLHPALGTDGGARFWRPPRRGRTRCKARAGPRALAGPPPSALPRVRARHPGRDLDAVCGGAHRGPVQCRRAQALPWARVWRRPDGRGAGRRPAQRMQGCHPLCDEGGNPVVPLPRLPPGRRDRNLGLERQPPRRRQGTSTSFPNCSPRCICSKAAW
jgi:hypothetical protein